MINIVIPMAGAGLRFQKAGYTTPKPFIQVLGKPMICLVLDNLNIADSKFILIVRAEHYNQEKDIINYIKEKYNVEFVIIDSMTEGAACTVLQTEKYINNSIPLLIANSDQIIDTQITDFINDSNTRNLDGSVLCFEDSDNKWSYAKVDNNGFITEIKEKEVISKFATVGIYYYKHGSVFVESAKEMIKQNDRVNNEFYVAPVYNYAVKKNKKFGIYLINNSDMHGIGTPEDLNSYIKLKQGN